MNERMAEMERTMAANLHEVRGREEEANRRVAEVDARIEEVRLDLVQKTADCVRLDESLKALEEGSSKAWTDLVKIPVKVLQSLVYDPVRARSQWWTDMIMTRRWSSTSRRSRRCERRR
jgi:chromosome segregation ATPase